MTQLTAAEERPTETPDRPTGVSGVPENGHDGDGRRDACPTRDCGRDARSTDEVVRELALELAGVFRREGEAEAVRCAEEEVRVVLGRGVGEAEVRRIIMLIGIDVQAGKVTWAPHVLRIAHAQDRSRERVQADQGYAWKLYREGNWGKLCPSGQDTCAGLTRIVDRKTSADIPCPVANDARCPVFQARRDRVIDLEMAQIGIGEGYRNKRAEEALPVIREMLGELIPSIKRAVEGGIVVWISGPTWTGKTCAAGMLVRAAVAADVKCVWRSEAQVIAQGVAAPAADAPLMVIDDIGATEGSRTKVDALLRYRTRERALATILTSNRELGELARAEGWERIGSSIADTGRTVKFWQPLRGVAEADVPRWAWEAWRRAQGQG